MLRLGGWPAWSAPPIELLAAPMMGSADALWLQSATETLAPSAPALMGSEPVVGLGLSTAFHLRDLRRVGSRPAALLPMPTDSELPPSVAQRLRLTAERAGIALVSPGDAAERPCFAALRALKAVRSVSVIVPNYNYSRYIEDRLRQINSQRYPVSEIIVLDDASADDSVERIKAILPRLSPPARLIANVRNSGSVFRQWKRGALAAGGDLVWIAEADDCAHPDFLAHLVPAFNDPAVAMAQAQSRQIGAEGDIRHNDYGFYLAEVGAERWTQSYQTDGQEQAASTLAVMNTIPNVSAVLFRREVLLAALEACASTLETFRLAGDWLVYLEVLARGDFAFARQVLNDHRFHEASITTSALTSLARVKEVGRMQKIARDRLRLPTETVSAATVYLQKLYDHFGLAESGAANVYDHPAFMALAPDQ